MTELSPEPIDWSEYIRLLFAGTIGAGAIWLAEKVTATAEIERVR